MTKEHPIQPSPELVSQWFLGAKAMPVDQWVTDVATKAAQWGANQELEACCEWLDERTVLNGSTALRTTRRPKPPSLKEQALEVVTGLEKRWDLQCDLACLRRALEALPND